MPFTFGRTGFLIHLLSLRRMYVRTIPLFAALALSTPALADIVPLALTVSGKIGVFNNSSRTSYRFEQKELQALPQHTMVTSTPWTKVSAFKGPRLEDILRRVKATGTHIDIVAFDGYIAHDIPITDVDTFHPLLAYMRDGVYLRLRDLGPIFLVYPRDDQQDTLKTSDYTTREIRQIKEVVVK